MLQLNPQIKTVSFKDYDKYFRVLLDTVEVQQQRILFYRQDKEGIIISFSYDLFIIMTRITFNEIHEMYKEDEVETIEVTGPEGATEEHPHIKKFKAEYLSRAIPEE